jgi:NADPH:quinone reductase-like Zn-dependent oxidoreductase
MHQENSSPVSKPVNSHKQKKMKAAIINHYRDGQAIELVENHPFPEAKAGQVVIEVHAASLNRIDSAIRSGYMQQMMPLQFPVVLGGDFSGVIRQVGPDVEDIHIGDEVYGQAGLMTGGSGSLAEFTVASASKLFKKPQSLTMSQSAVLPLAGASAIQALEEHMNLQPGQKILIHGGAGAIGSLAIQLAKHHGAFVATTVNGKDTQFVRSLGADLVIDYKTQSFTCLIHDYDAVLVNVAEMLGRSYSVLKEGGILVSLVAPVDEQEAQDNQVLARMQYTQSSTQQLERLTTLVDTGKINPVIDATFHLDQIQEAFNHFEQQHPKGKVVINLK